MIKKTAKKRRKVKDPKAEAAYQRCLDGIRCLFDEMKAKGIDPFPRFDILTCQACGAYEDESFQGLRFIADKNGKPIKEGQEFIIQPQRYPKDALEEFLEGLGLGEEGAKKKIKFLMEPEMFIILSWKETKRRLKNGTKRYWMKYDFICSVCGAQQQETCVADFEELPEGSAPGA